MAGSTRSIFITAASGNIGQQLIPLLLSSPDAAFYKLVLPTRSASKVQALVPEGTAAQVVIAEGDPFDTVWVEKLLVEHKVDTVFSNFVGTEELLLTLNLWNAAENAGVKHYIFLSAAGDMSPQAVVAGALKNVDAMHVAIKFFVEQKLAYGSPKFTWTSIGPSLFFSNDLRSKKGMMEHGFFDEPLGRKGVSRVDTADIATAVKNAIEDFGKNYNRRKINIGSKKLYNSHEIERLWSEALGRQIKAAGSDPESWAQAERDFGAKLYQPGWPRDLVLMYKQFDIDGFGMTDAEYQEQVEFLGREPADYEAFVKTTAEKWLSEK